MIIGAGAAGLSLALQLADQHSIFLVAKGPLRDGASLYAQGGVAAVLTDKDSIDAHLMDTLEAGAGLCDETVVRHVVEQGRHCIRWLIDQGVDFTRHPGPPYSGDFGSYHLNREGGHAHRRIIHAADATGRAIVQTLEQRVRLHPRIRVLDYHNAVDLITAERHLPGSDMANRCLGGYLFDRKHGRVITVRAAHTVLATGGASKAYLYTSNPDVATGDGIAMAWRAGCRVGNLEFIQFHPTCLYHPQAKSFLLSEALRGEGAVLKRPDGHRFMPDHDERGELAPRDVVARAIDSEMKQHGLDFVLLDISHKPPEFTRTHFPTLVARCLEYGFDLTTAAVPVVPAAHYTCGGIVTDLNAQTDLPGLYAIGECAYTGLHGANRLASNSLLECLVFAQACARHIDQSPAETSQRNSTAVLPPWDESQVTDSDEEVVVSHNWDELRRFMWDYVGIVRTTKRLQRAAHRVALLQAEIDEYYGNFRVTNDLL
ncbi:MAG: L-aspartate oxidase, partial [Pseudomonadota bacterium]|nr:L-aspartate oxidase [Pseudomonadota bacterium]